MAPYLFLFYSLAFFALELPPLSRAAHKVLLAVSCFLMWLMAATRFEVGGDWPQYLDHFYVITHAPVEQSLGMFEPGWVMFNLLAEHIGADVFGVNGMAAAIAMFGIYLMCTMAKKPLTGLVVAFPYTFVVVVMGFVRQSISIGFFAIAIYVLEKRRSPVGAFLICALGLLFHSTAIFALMFILAGTALIREDGTTSKKKIFIFILLQIGLIVLLTSLSSIGSKYDAYSDYDYNPIASRARAFFNVCVFAMWYSVRASLQNRQVRVLGDMAAVVSLGCFIGVWFFPLIVDRLVMYFLPLHIYVLGNVRFGRLSGLFRKSLVLGSCAYILVWFAYANNAASWLPYRSVLMGH
jgi:hypothetical protein